MQSRLSTTRRLTIVWVVLLALTFGSSVIGIEQSAPAASAAAVLAIGVALFKVRLIGIHFMELRIAPWPLRLAYEGYVLAVFVALVLIDLLVVP